MKNLLNELHKKCEEICNQNNTYKNIILYMYHTFVKKQRTYTVNYFNISNIKDQKIKNIIAEIDRHNENKITALKDEINRLNSIINELEEENSYLKKM